MNVNHPSITAVLMHREVSRAMNGATVATPALKRLIRARVSRRNVLRGQANYREELPFARAVERNGGSGAAFEAGYAIAPPDGSKAMPGILTRFREALTAPGLPEDLRPLVEAALRETDAG